MVGFTVTSGTTTQVKIVSSDTTTQVKKVVVGRPVRRVQQAGNSIGTASDVDISTLQNGSLLVYNSSSSKWTSTTELANQNINGGTY